MNTKQTKQTKRFALGLAAAAVIAMTSSACTNPEVPAGHEGYVYYIPLVLGKMEYRKSLRGPASTGVAWRLFTINIDMRERTYTEHFKLLTADNLSIKFEVNTALKLRDGQVKTIVEEWGGPHWYDWRVKEPLRTTVRKAVAAEHADRIQTQTQKLARDIRAALEKQYNNTPIEIRSVDIGHIEFPKAYAQAIRNKIAKTEELKRQAAVLLKTEEEAKGQVVNALNVALAQRIISESLSPLYVQYRAMQVYKKLAASKNKTIILLPNTTDGTGMPKVLARTDKLRKLTPDEEKWFKAMQKEHYDQETLDDMRTAVNQLKKQMATEAARRRKRKGLRATPTEPIVPKKKPADDAVKTPVDAVKTPVDAAKKPVDAVKKPVDAAKKPAVPAPAP